MMTRFRRTALACAAASAAYAGPAHAQTPHTEPRLVEPGAVAAELSEAYPARFDRLGAGGIVRVRLFVDTAGKADSLHVTSSTGLAELDGAALSALRSAKWVPGRDGDGPVGAWFELTLQFPSRVPDDPEARPVPANRDEVAAAIRPRVPGELRARRTRVDIPILLSIDASGRVIGEQSLDSGCFPSASKIALDMAKTLVFEPASGSRETALTVTFDDSVTLLLRGDSMPAPRPRQRASTDAATGPTKRPELQNQVGVQQALVRNYPKDLRDRGQGGAPVIRLWIDEQGRVTTKQVARHSGYCALDLAALQVAHTMRFTPALNRGVATAVWVEIPVVFSSR